MHAFGSEGSGVAWVRSGQSVADRGISFGGHMASAGARAYNGSLGAKPPVAVQGADSPVWGQGVEAALKLNAF